MTPAFYLVGEASPCLQPLCPRVPQTFIPATFFRHPREGGDLLSNPRPNRLPDTPSPKGTAPKTLLAYFNNLFFPIDSSTVI